MMHPTRHGYVSSPGIPSDVLIRQANSRRPRYVISVRRTQTGLYFHLDGGGYVWFAPDADFQASVARVKDLGYVY